MKKILLMVFKIWKPSNLFALNSIGLNGPSIGFASFAEGKFIFIKKLSRSRSINNINKIDIGLDTMCKIDKNWIKNKIMFNKDQIVGGHCKFTKDLNNLIDDCGLKIIIIRDPRDILLSFCDWIKKEKDYFLFEYFQGKSDDYIIKSYINGFEYKKTKFYSFNTILKYFDGWLETNDKLVIKFEDL